MVCVPARAAVSCSPGSSRSAPYTCSRCSSAPSTRHRSSVASNAAAERGAKSAANSTRDGAGSPRVAGSASSDPADYTTSNGDPIARNLARIGGDWERLQQARRSEGAVAAFLELHVEQGGVLEERGDWIGVVEGVVGQRRFTVTIDGQANHAGTTPMAGRRDALTAAAAVVLAVQQLALQHPGDPVATVGRLEVWPNAANVVPGRVQLSVDLRDLQMAVLDALSEQLGEALTRIAPAVAARSASNRSLRWIPPRPIHG